MALFYISTKYHKNIPKELSLSNITKGDNAKSKKGRVVILVPITSHPFLHFYQVPSKYSKGYSSYRADTKSLPNITKGDNAKRKAVIILVRNMSSSPFYISTKYHENIPKDLTYRADTKSMDNHCQI